jgi:hypothetical protein
MTNSVSAIVMIKVYHDELVRMDYVLLKFKVIFAVEDPATEALEGDVHSVPKNALSSSVSCHPGEYSPAKRPSRTTDRICLDILCA